MPRYTLETIIIVLLILWLMGWLAFPIGGNLIHLLLVIILIVVLIRLLQGRSLLP
ncbi:MAG TPA: lmo0937 family membrane protein [Gemmataceae bacterium]|nr:lmo0937 family membrane protein [Gemmataceae bacterium]